MVNIEYTLIGFFNNDPDESFNFLIPIFQFNDQNFRYEIDLISSRIVDFLPIDCKIESHIPHGESLIRQVGDEAIFMFEYNSKIHIGNKLQIGIDLIKLVKLQKLSPLDLYNIYSFLGISEKIDESIVLIVKEYKSTGITARNFYRPEIKEVTVNQFIEKLIFFATLLENTGKKIVYSWYFPKSQNSFSITMNDVRIHKSVLKDSFNNIINYNESKTYKDLVVITYSKLQNEIDLSEVPAYKLRKLMDLFPVKGNELIKDHALVINSQSNCKSSKNLTLLAYSMTNEVIGNQPLTVNKRNLGAKEIKDIEETDAIKYVIMEGERA